MASASAASVHVHVYDLNTDLNDYGIYVGVGIFHTGCEVYGREYAFGYHDEDNETGVFDLEPRAAPAPAVFRETIEIGETKYSVEECARVIGRLKRAFPGPSYDLLKRNCNTFTEALVEALCPEGGKVPGYVNRLAHIGRFANDYAPCFVPASIRGAITTVPGKLTNGEVGDGEDAGDEDAGEDVQLLAPVDPRME